MVDRFCTVLDLTYSLQKYYSGVSSKMDVSFSKQLVYQNGLRDVLGLYTQTLTHVFTK